MMVMALCTDYCSPILTIYQVRLVRSVFADLTRKSAVQVAACPTSMLTGMLVIMCNSGTQAMRASVSHPYLGGCCPSYAGHTH